MNNTFGDRYRGTVGMLAWGLHRVSGIILTIYMLFYIYSLRAAQQGAQSFNQMMQGYQTPFWRFMGLLLLLMLLFHTFTGIRVLLFDAGKGLGSQRALFWIAFVLSIAIFLFSAVIGFTNLPPAAGVSR